MRRVAARPWRRILFGEPGAERKARIALLLLLLAGLIARVALIRAYQPGILSNWDSSEYLNRAENGLWLNLHQPMGYSIFLRAMHLITDSLSLMMVFQHVIGLLTAVAGYDAARRLGAGRLAALIPVAAVAINLDVIYLEHAPLSEALFIPFIVGTVWALARALTASTPRRQLAWIAVAGLLAGGLPAIRTVGLVFLPFAAFGALLVAGRLRWAVVTGAVFAATAGGLLGAYAIAQHDAVGGGYSLVRGQGWAAYSDVAPKADCKRFRPPSGTRVLCEATPPAERGRDANFYGFSPESPAYKLAPNGFPSRDGLFAKWAAAARASLTDEQPFPLDLISDTAVGLLPHGVTDIGFDRLSPEVSDYIRKTYSGYVDVGETKLASPYSGFVELQPYFRLSGSMALLGGLLVFAALLWGRGRRWAMALIIVPVFANWALAMDLQRYYAPTYVLLAIAVALALSSLAARFEERTRERLAPPDPGGW